MKYFLNYIRYDGGVSSKPKPHTASYYAASEEEALRVAAVFLAWKVKPTQDPEFRQALKELDVVLTDMVDDATPAVDALEQFLTYRDEDFSVISLKDENEDIIIENDTIESIETWE
jgi:hypothetical protein